MHNLEFKILECQNPEFKILECQNLEFRILVVQNLEFRILDCQNPEFKILDCQNPEFEVFWKTKLATGADETQDGRDGGFFASTKPNQQWRIQHATQSTDLGVIS